MTLPVDLTMTKPVMRLQLSYEAWKAVLAVLLIAVSMIIPDLAGDQYWTHVFRLVNLYILASIFQNILLRDAGQSSFGQGAIFGAAAYGTAIAYGLHGFSYLASAAIGVVAAIALSILFALPALRVQGFYLGVVTLSAATAFSEMTRVLGQWTNGYNGINVATPQLETRAIFGMTTLSVIVLLATCGGIVFHLYLRRTVLGRRLRVAASSPELAQSLGINPGLMRSIGFIIAGIGTGIAGSLFPASLSFVNPAAFNLDLSVLFFFAVVIGGRGQLLGPVVGIWLLYLLPNALLANFVEYRLLAYGVLALVTMTVFPDGIVGSLERVFRKKQGASPLDIGRLIDKRLKRKTLKVSEPTAISISSARKLFGKAAALNDVHLCVAPQKIHALVGANGSGKTTLLNAISGFIALNAGSVQIKGHTVNGLAPHAIARLGIARTFQVPRLISDLTLRENLLIGCDANAARNKSEEDDLMEYEDISIESVPHGPRRLIELVRVCMAGPDIIMLDEPAAGLSVEERAEFSRLLIRLRDECGLSIVLIEHDLDLVWGIADHVTVLEAGQVIADGTPKEVILNPKVKSLFVEIPNA